MNKKFTVTLLVLISFVSSAVFAKRDVTDQVLGAENSWEETFDINNKKSGKYNIMVTAEDKAGNTSVAGPYNIYIDPESDLPVTGITNPVENMRVPGNLNIVGTCVDDDQVELVYLILDGDKDHPVAAEGREYWSYYLDTTELLEGPHTIEAYGIDNGNPQAYLDENGNVDMSRVVPKKGHPVKVTWQLDRRAPSIDITNHYMGELVSGTINLEGTVKDGNGIKNLEFSSDGGKFFSPVKLKEVRYKQPDENGNWSEWRFSVKVNTKDFADGACTAWFKATDGAGTIGRYAFLYFIDNTKPDLQIITPEKDRVMNGVFTVAGYAKDVIGISKLTWQWGSETGEFELTPGNPYFVKEVNSIGKSKSEVFVVTATDTLGNTVSLKKTIALDQEQDKPVVNITAPGNGTDIDGLDGTVFLRGYATDDDGVISITYSVDAGEEVTVPVTGVFEVDIPGTLSYGSHSISVFATDKYGVRGNTVKSAFTAKGDIPQFGTATYKAGRESVEFVDGLAVNPEADGSVEIPVSVTSGLTSVDYSITWGKDSAISGALELKGGEKSATVSLPLYGDDLPWGVAKINVVAKDIFNRTAKFTKIVSITDLTKPHASTPGVYFTDKVSRVAGNTVTGYFVGGKISSVSTVPALRSVTATYEGQSVILNATQATDSFKVRVVTESGATYDSEEIKFTATPVVPVIKIDSSSAFDTEKGVPFKVESASSVLRITGTVENATSVKYRVLSVKSEFVTGVLTSSSVNEPTEFKDVSVSRRGAFTIDGFEPFVEGVSVVEIVAEGVDGLNAVDAVYVNNIPFAPTMEVVGPDGKAVKKADPKLFWLKGQDYYCVAVYQGKLDSEFKRVKSSELRADSTSFVFSVTPQDVDASKKVSTYTSESLSVQAGSRVSASISKVDGADYKSGMIIVMDRNTGKEAGHTATVKIKSNAAIKSVSYKITGESYAGGEQTVSGNAAIRAITEGSLYEADIPLANLPARVNNIEVKVANVKDGTAETSGSIIVTRNHAVLDSEQKIYWIDAGSARYDSNLGSYVLDDDAYLIGYANVPGPVKGSVRGSESFECESEGNIIRIKGKADGTFRDVSLRATAEDGGYYSSSAVSIVVDTSKPTIKLDSPVNMGFVKNSFTLSGTATDGNGIASLEYTLMEEVAPVVAKDGTVTETPVEWNKISVTRSGAFSVNVNLADYDDGFVPVSLRATDTTGKVSVLNIAVHKDVTPPQVVVLLPDADAIINGENSIVFYVKDEGLMENIQYVSADSRIRNTWKSYISPNLVPPAEEGVADYRYSLKTLNSSLPNLRIGTKENPIDNRMQFTFADAAGNRTVIDKWDFVVDEESDKPRTEIHLPEDNQVITTDFVISGVVYDDDGPCKVYYKIDNGDYELVSDELVSSFKKDKLLSDMTDNEHVITAYAVDINGVRGDSVTRQFRVSLEEPKGAMTAPEISTTVKDTVTIKGWASDKNNISRVQISVDNGASYNDAVGTTNWSYTFDTKVIQDGTHVVFIKVWDGYDITGLYSSLINIDNTSPELTLDFPLDDSKISKNIFFSGQTTDNIGLINLYLTLRSLDGKTIPNRLARRDLVPAEVISQVLDISELNDGFYNIELTGTDAAGNITRKSRNIQLDKTKLLSKVDLLYPLNGEHKQGEFNIYGSVTTEKDDPIENVELYLDGEPMYFMEVATIAESGYFRFRMKKEFEIDAVGAEPWVLSSGKHSYRVVATTKSGKHVSSNEQTFVYDSYGPWVTLDNFVYGDFAVNRPLLKGDAGYLLTEEEKQLLKSKDTPTEIKEAIEQKRVKRVLISFDNGKSYTPVSKLNKGSWSYRVENLDIPAGYHFMLIKAEMYNGENAITRVVVQVDRTNPYIKLISPGEGGHYNQLLGFDGLSNDDVDLKNVTLTLRKGDKANYEIPGFIQGLYFDASVWGATLYNVGVGLTAFDGAVKIQANFGQFTQEQRDAVSDFFGVERTKLRFGGNVIGAKIIAQLGYIPFRYFFGRDWDWLSATIAVGANFSYFTRTGASITSGEEVPQMLSAALVQVEFPRITIEKNKAFKTWALYGEPQVWFIPSDIASDDAKKFVFTYSLGLRTCVF